MTKYYCEVVQYSLCVYFRAGMVGLQPSVCSAVTPVKTSTPTSRQAGLDQLDALGKSMLQQRSVSPPK